MEERDYVLSSFHSETVTDEEDEDRDDQEGDLDPLLSSQDPENMQRKPRRSRTRVVFNTSTGRSESSSSCSICSIKSFLCLLLLMIVAGVVVLLKFQDEAEADIESEKRPSMDYINFIQPDNMVSFQDMLEDNFTFNLTSKTDVMVFLHIQKTGGTTFGKHLVQDIDLEQPCDCRKKRRRRKFHCDCFRPGTKDSNWLFSRYSTGWKCGLHPDWTELTSCVDAYMKHSEGETGADRRYFYITFLREPVSRYLSEWRHVQRGATWRDAQLRCGGHAWSEVIPTCYNGSDWSHVSLSDFMSCPHNLASNRQTRMLADLELINCYNETGADTDLRNKIMLNSAKTNLANMAYFGLTEHQEQSQYLFEETFNLMFKTDFEQLDQSDTHSGHFRDDLDEKIIEKIRNLNQLDIELYKYAQQLLTERFQSMKEADESFEKHFQDINKEKKFSWEDIEDEDYDNGP